MRATWTAVAFSLVAAGTSCRNAPAPVGGASGAPGAAVASASAVGTAATAATEAGAAGSLRVVAGEHGFEPASLALPRGGPGSKATVTFVRTTNRTCATEIVMPALAIRRELPLGEPVTIEIPTDTARTLAYACGMGMHKGALVVN